MFGKLCTALICLLLLRPDGCGSKGGGDSKQAGAQQVASAPVPADAGGRKSGPAPAPGREACALVENAEVEAVQGAKVQSVVPSSQPGAGLAISQCFYTVISADGSKNLSVHVEVTENAPGSPNRNALADLWRERFQGAKEKKKADKPRPVPGVGDGAYWVGNNKMGALYVLQRDRLVRVSVGGPDEEAAKIEKSKALALKALSRLK